jgi:hypothetical protein
MKAKLFYVVAILLSVLTAQAHAVETWTVTAFGTIDVGLDYSGVFGRAGQRLDGMSYVESITTIIDPNSWPTYTATENYLSLYGAGPSVYVTITINSHKVSFFAPSTTLGDQELSNNESVESIPRTWDKVFSYQVGATPNGSAFGAYISVLSAQEFVPTTSFHQNISQNTAGDAFDSYAWFSLSGQQIVEFGGKISHLDVRNNVPIVAVPEPETYAMLLAGLGILGFVARRKPTTA